MSVKSVLTEGLRSGKIKSSRKLPIKSPKDVNAGAGGAMRKLLNKNKAATITPKKK